MALARLRQPQRSNTAGDSTQWPPREAMPNSQADRERALREAREAQRISEEIDRRLAQERASQHKAEPHLKILLLGQSESGKSTTLKAFKLQYAPRQFEAETDFWTAVVLLNLVRSVTKILDYLAQYDKDIQSSVELQEYYDVSRDLVTLRMRLSPLVACETSIRRRISPDSPHIQLSNHNRNDLQNGLQNGSSSSSGGPTMYRRSSLPELAVRPPHVVTGSRPSMQHGLPSPAIEQDFQRARRVIESLAGDMKMLWNDNVVKGILRQYNVDLLDQPGFFLNDLERIASRSYKSSIEDVLKARLRTTGAVEHIINVENGQDQGKQWLMIDVGGSRRQRLAWASFFEHVHSIIFLAPISAFNQQLDEDDQVNRLEDTVLSWKTICSNQLLAKVHMICFMNKIDVLQQKLREGARFSDWVTNYKGENTVKGIVKYLEHKFKFIHQQHSPVPRTLGIFATSVIDHRTTPAVLAQVRSVIVRNMLYKTGML